MNRRYTSWRSIAAALPCVLALAGAAAAEAQNMIGRQSQNEGILVLPKQGAVTIDGDLSDWDLSGRIWVFADRDVRSRFSAKVSAMWDESNLYVAVRWKDPTPMYSMVDPDFNPNDGWKSDSVQLRVSTSDRDSWLTTWHFAAKKMPVLHVAKWKDRRNSRAGQDVTLLAAEPGGTRLGSGAEMAYRADADGKGYEQEMKIPWAIIYRTPPTPAAGMTLRIGMEFLWGDPTGKVWPIHRYADNMQPGVTSREFYWTAKHAWGDAKLVGAGNVEVRKYVGAGAKLEGLVPIRLQLPKDAARFSIVVDDANGGRIRSMGGLDPADYTVAASDDTVTVEVMWDGTTDKIWKGNHRDGYRGEGTLVDTGTYRAHGLYHKGLGAEYEMCFYNPGTPPWPTGDGKGAWGADHRPPKRVARSGDWMIVTWAFAEGGSGIIGIDETGRKRWGEKRGANLVAADARYVYAIPAGWHVKHDAIIRLDARKGAYKPFVRDGKALPFELRMEAIFGGEAPGKPVALAASESLLALGMSEGVIALLDKETAELRKRIAARGVKALAFSGEGKFYAVLDDGLNEIDTGLGFATAIATPGLGEAGAIAVDADGNIVAADTGPDSQVKAYSPRGALIYTCGRKGGRPIRGRFDPQAMVRMSSVAVDATGRVWVVESWDYPRRVSVWERGTRRWRRHTPGALVRDYIGNTGYAGTGCFLHDQDPTLAYVGPIELKLDKAKGTWRVTQVLWVPDKAAGEHFDISTGSHSHPQRFRSDASGRMREYLFSIPYRDHQGYVLFMERDGGWKPVSAITTVGRISGKTNSHGHMVEAPTGDFAWLNTADALFWNDENRDGKVQRSECEVVPARKPATGKRRGEYGLPLGSGWGGRIGRDLVFYANGLARYEPVGFTPDGAPLYGKKGLKRLDVEDNGTLVPVPEENLLLCLSWKGYAGPTRVAGIDTGKGVDRWTYPNPYPGVHGSHRATMPKPGLLIGPLKIAGVAKANDDAGNVFLMRGNLGQDFFMTTDGVYVDAMFQDGRLPGMSLPGKESQLDGMPMEAFSNGGEPFNGWFGTQDDGVTRMTVGFPRQAAMVLRANGLESIRRFTARPVRIDERLLASLRADNLRRAARAAAAGTRKHTVKRAPANLRIDGDAVEWDSIPGMKMIREGSPSTGVAKLAYDAKSLYVLFEVNDPTPWRNEGKDFARLFKTGDAVDVQLGPTGNAGRDPAPGDLRVVIADLGRRPTAVLMKPKDPTAPAHLKKSYTSPVGTKGFDRVEVIAGARVRVKSGGGKYTVEAAIPFDALGFTPSRGAKLTGDVGFMSSDADGKVNTARTYMDSSY
ncbi:MAG: sugar-binding protein [Planctomycetota bacterium]|jgi:hypothetical protein